MAAKNSSSKESHSAKREVTVPLALRAGGAFIALAVALAIFGITAWLSDGWAVPFAITPAFLGICVAAVLFGAFATVNRAQKPSVAQVVALSIAVAFIVVSQFLPKTPLGFMGQHWLFMYAILCVICALVLRRSVMPKI
ncbi:hypothetical protein [Corynebacterium pseudodiphtheriticum]|uniref:Uncharacterized protein n=1 Tax=Corynebacterium pseudodiphtheriticum TaxID=37637 RepID=A0ABT7FX29_9CORY|nr:hypothetical protein [Corynebacterium pseudodiphtheriticum]MDC7113497.1 hypothetical protein [Corynebacterium pseudodiphtheriticum]MDK4273977.1 hypothetical protein [Corynebacterium pseudodiphtheriticum]MDK4290544.1 hypothetical protein [Corynebacterium pseudodiphtheriticum]MDK4328960.1 hypothetical protein [Corynebacterium pseudodiphtheriticum]RUP95051.1 hypothetical protein D8M19_01895 [Corynebacterium pseudodiphtheriticum]